MSKLYQINFLQQSFCHLLRNLGCSGIACNSRNITTSSNDTKADNANLQSYVAEFKKATEAQSIDGRTAQLLCRTQVSDPAHHTSKHIGLFYTLPDDHVKQWSHRAFNAHLTRVHTAFNETALMVRKPFVELKTYLEAADYAMPNVRYLIYGRLGTGKTHTMAHLQHYCGSQGWLLVTVPWGAHWNRYYKTNDLEETAAKDGSYHLHMAGTEWLTYFKQTNLNLLNKLDLRTHGEYVYSKREKTSQGDSLLEAIDFGINRPNFSNDVVKMLTEEIKIQSSSKKFRTLVNIDGVNAFWQDTIYKSDWRNKWLVPASKITIVQHMKSLLQNDWTNGAIVCTVDTNANYNEKESFLPKYALGEEAFEFFDPSIPIQVDNYTEKEVNSQLQYYIDRQWIQNPEALTDTGRKQILFLSGNNGGELFKVCQGL